MLKTALDWKIEHYEFLLERAENKVKKHKKIIKRLKKKYTAKQLIPVANSNRLLNYSPGRLLDEVKSNLEYDENEVKKYKKDLINFRKLR